VQLQLELGGETDRAVQLMRDGRGLAARPARIRLGRGGGDVGLRAGGKLRCGLTAIETACVMPACLASAC
jgi:hypothetical protein